MNSTPDGILIGEAKLENIVDLRHVVLRQGLPREAAVFAGDELPTTVHLAGWKEGRVVGCATFHLNQWKGDPAWQLRGMATAAALRGKGVGSEMLRVAEEMLRQRHPTRQLWCNARTPAVEFYRKQGWVTVGEEFHIETAGPHFVMKKTMG